MENMKNTSMAMTEAMLQRVEPNTDVMSEQPTLTRMITPFEAMVSEDAQAEIGCVPVEMEKYEAQGFFAPTVGMLQIVNKFNGCLFAYIQENENGNRDIRFIQQYQDGTYSPEFSISQSDLLTVTAGSIESNRQDPETRRDCRRCLRRIRADYLNKCCGKEIPNILEVITSLAEVMSKLPVVSERSEMPRAQLYAEVLKVMDIYCPEVSRHFRRGGYFILTEQEVGKIAQEMEMSDRRLAINVLPLAIILIQTSRECHQPFAVCPLPNIALPIRTFRHL